MTRNRKILEAVLNGLSFKKAGEAFGVNQVTARTAFLREVRKTVPAIWDEGKAAGVSGTYATPALRWLRENKASILDAKPARPAWKRGGKKEVLATDETLSDPLRIPLSDLLGRPPEHLIAECAKYLKDGETPVQRIERERRDTDAALTLLIREKARTKALEELLCSAHCIALRHGADTAWDTFAASIRALGIGAVTARVYKVPRDELA